MNVLARRDVAIVSAEPGTTRDVLEVHLDLGGYAVVVADTAGLRDPAGDIEREGMRRTRERARAAHLVLWVVDATAPVTPPPDLAAEPARILQVANKSDLVDPARRSGTLSSQSAATGAPLSISALTGAGLPELLDRIAALVASNMDGGAGAIVPTQARHRVAMQACAEALARFLSPQAPSPELAAEDLRLAADALGRITGRIDAEEVLGQIFGRFCIGK